MAKRHDPARVPGLGWFGVAAVAGLIHAAISAYWAVGGSWLLDTVGPGAAELQRRGGPLVTVMLAVVALAKTAGAVVPYVDHRGGNPHGWVRIVSWCGAAVLLLWGGWSTIGAWWGAASGQMHDRAAFVGHGLLWDPLFVAWGGALAAGLMATRSRGRGAVT